MSAWQKWTKISLWKRSIAALILGVIIGLIFKDYMYIVEPIGNTFMKLLKMMVMPLIFITLIHSIINLKSTTSIGTLALKGILWFVSTTALAVVIAVIAAQIVKPGIGLTIDFTNLTMQAKTPPSLLDTFLNIIPSNPINSFVDGNVLQVIFLAVFTGIILAQLKTEKLYLTKVIDTINNIIFGMIGFILELMPIGVFALIAYSASVMGYDLIIKLGAYVLLVFALCLFQVFVVFAVILKLTGNNLKNFYKNAVEVILVAFSTSSSSASLPTTLEYAKKMGVNESTRSFILPLGSTINMNGSAIHQAVAAVFIAQIVGYQLDFSHYVILLIATVVSAIGTAGVPGVGLIMMTIIFNAIGLPLEGIAIVAGVDRILDMTRTAVNVTGDLMVARIISTQESKKALKKRNTNTAVEQAKVEA